MEIINLEGSGFKEKRKMNGYICGILRSLKIEGMVALFMGRGKLF